MADEPSDTDRWTVRGVPKAYRDQAAQAAQRLDISVGTYVCQALDLRRQAEREPLDLLAPADTMAGTSDLPADALSDAQQILALIERATAAATLLANTPGLPTRFRQQAMRALREALPRPVTRTRLALTLAPITSPQEQEQTTA